MVRVIRVGRGPGLTQRGDENCVWSSKENYADRDWVSSGGWQGTDEIAGIVHHPECDPCSGSVRTARSVSSASTSAFCCSAVRLVNSRPVS